MPENLITAFNNQRYFNHESGCPENFSGEPLSSL